MNKNKGFIDPVSLSLILVFAIGTAGVVTGKNTVNQAQMVQSNQTEITASDKEEPKT